MSWIFQAVPKRYDLREEMKEGRTENWLVTRYGDEMQKGDLVYFWLAGDESIRGLYGWGRLVGAAPQFYAGWGHGIEILYERIFKDEDGTPAHVPVSALRGLPHFGEHTLFKMAIGTNFKLTPEQDQEIREAITKKFGEGMVPND